MNRDDGSEADWQSEATREFAGQVARLYRLIHGRQADAGGLKGAVRELRRETPLAVLFAAGLGSDEFASRGGRRPATPADVDDMFRAAFGREPPVLGPGTRELPVEQYAAAVITAEERRSPTPLTSALHVEGFDPEDATTYRRWLEDHYTPDQCSSAAIRTAAAALPPQVAVSFMIMGTAPSGHALEATLRSLQAQLCDRFEIIAVGNVAFCDGAAALSALPLKTVITTGNVARAFTAGLRSCSGEFVFLLRPGMILAPDTSYHLAVATADDVERRHAAVLLDHDRIDPSGQRRSPWFATGWDPETALFLVAVTQCAMLRTTMARSVGMRDRYRGLEWHDLVLRVTGRVGDDAVGHIARPLVSLPSADPGQQAVGAGPARSKIGPVWTRLANRRLAAGFPPWRRPRLANSDGGTRVVYPLPLRAPLVSIIIPTRDKPDLLAKCIDGLLNKTVYANIEVIVIDNLSVDPRTHLLFSSYRNESRIRIIKYPSQFNWGAVNNFGVSSSHGDIVVLLNNDTEVLEPNWLTELTRLASRSDVGAAGATLLYPNGAIQHAGLVFGPAAAAYHRFRHEPDRGASYGGALSMARQVSAVTGACLAIRRSVFEAVRGIEAVGLTVTWSDVDLCFKVRELGYRVVVTPFATMRHLELATRGSDDTPERAARAERERQFMLVRWPQLADEDRFYNPNLHIGEGSTKIAGTPRRPFKRD